MFTFIRYNLPISVDLNSVQLEVYDLTLSSHCCDFAQNRAMLMIMTKIMRHTKQNHAFCCNEKCVHNFNSYDKSHAFNNFNFLRQVMFCFWFKKEKKIMEVTEKLIMAVRCKPILFSKNLSDHCKKHLVLKAWETVSGEVGVSGKHVN